MPVVAQTHSPPELLKPGWQLLQLLAVLVQVLHPGMQGMQEKDPPQLPLLTMPKYPAAQVTHTAL